MVPPPPNFIGYSIEGHVNALQKDWQDRPIKDQDVTKSNTICIRLRYFGIIALMPLLAASQSATIGTSVVGYNHRDQGIVFSVNGQVGSYVQPHKDGGGFSCCVSIPNPWHPGMTATVKWRWGGTDEWFEQTIPVPEYDAQQTGRMSVHFMSPS